MFPSEKEEKTVVGCKICVKQDISIRLSDEIEKMDSTCIKYIRKYQTTHSKVIRRACIGNK
jgi:hypothetical protein